MPVHVPGRRAGSGSVLRSAKKQMEKKGGRTVFAALNLTSMVDFMTVVVIFLLMNFSASGEMPVSKDISLPEAQNSDIMERVPTIVISADAIVFEGRAVASVASLLPEEQSPLVVELMPVLDQSRETYKTLNPNKEFDHKIMIQADQGVPWGVIRRVMNTAVNSDYGNALLAIRIVGGGSSAPAP